MPSPKSRPAFWLTLAFALGAATWIHVLATWPPTIDRFSDLYPRWHGSRELLLHRRDPYAPGITREIQIWQRNRPAHPGEDEGRFAYPVYVSFVLAPSIFADFWTVNTVMFWLILCCSALSALVYLRFVDWRGANWTWLAVVLFTLGTFPVVFSARARQLAPVVGFLLAAALLCILRRHLVWSGILLALATIKPQLTILIVPWLLLWSCAEWRRRRGLFLGFASSMALLMAASEWLVPGWIREFVASASAYTRYTDGRSVLQLFFTRPGGTAASILVLVVLAIVCWRLRRSEPRSPEFVGCTVLVLATSLTVIPTMAPHGQVLLLPAVLLLLKDRRAILGLGGAARYLWMSACALVAWQWLGALVFSAAVAVMGAAQAHRLWLVPLYASPVAPLAVALALAVGDRSLFRLRDQRALSAVTQS